jgi:hypothetical protein
VVNAAGDLFTTSGLAWKINGGWATAVVGAGRTPQRRVCWPTGRGESNIMVCGGF